MGRMGECVQLRLLLLQLVVVIVVVLAVVSVVVPVVAMDPVAAVETMENEVLVSMNVVMDLAESEVWMDGLHAGDVAIDVADSGAASDSGLTLLMPDIFSDHMVLPSWLQVQPRIWGTVLATTAVPLPSTLRIAIVEATNASVEYDTIVQVAANGSFVANLPSVEPSLLMYNVSILTTTSNETLITYTDVVFGIVYFCGGQSNMELGVNEAFDADQTISEAANFPYLRLFTVNRSVSDVPLNYTISRFPPGTSAWQRSAPSSVNGTYTDASFSFYGYFSAVCYYSGRSIYTALNGQYPIGLIESCWSGTPIQPWTSPWGISQCTSSSSAASTGPIDFDAIGNDEDDKDVARELAQLVQGQPTANSVLWNAMVLPIVQYPIHGVFWYQGESNAGQPVAYECQFPAMINDWRRQWQLDFEFYFVQLSGYSPNSTSLAFPELRQAQLVALDLEGVYLAAAYDIGDAYSHYGTVHPQNKSEVGRRLSLLARRHQFGDVDVIDYGPRVAAWSWSSSGPSGQGENVITFKLDPSDPGAVGLAMRGTATCSTCCTPGTSWMEIGSTANNTWVSADVKVDAASYTFVAAATMPANVAADTVRFAYRSFPECALYSEATQLPMLPFVYARESGVGDAKDVMVWVRQAHV